MLQTLLTGGSNSDWNKVFLDVEATILDRCLGGLPGVSPLGGAWPRFELLLIVRSMPNKTKIESELLFRKNNADNVDGNTIKA